MKGRALAAVLAALPLALHAQDAQPRYHVGPGVNAADIGLGDYVLKWWLPTVDLEQRHRHATANARLGPPPADRPRVVFLGDSITESWADLESAPPGPLQAVNRGISGQVSTQMLLRLQPDVLALRPRVLVLLAGTNDLRVGTDWTPQPTALQTTRLLENLATMVDAAQGRGIRVVLCTLPPVSDDHFDAAKFPFRSTVLRPPAAIVATNDAIRRLARERGVALVDYHAALVDGRGLLPRETTDDGLHPNAEGYRRMRAALQPVLAQALR